MFLMQQGGTKSFAQGQKQQLTFPNDDSEQA